MTDKVIGRCENFIWWINHRFKPAVDGFPAAYRNHLGEFVISADRNVLYPIEDGIADEEGLPLVDYFGPAGWPWINSKIKNEAESLGLRLSWKDSINVVIED